MAHRDISLPGLSRKDGVPSKRWQLTLEFSVDTASHSISRSELVRLLGRPDAPLLLDVRPPARFAASEALLACALRCPPDQVAQIAASGPPRDAVVYCVYGHGVGIAAAAALREAGWNARFLAGGIEGGEDGVDDPLDVARWRAEPLPLLRKRPDLGVTGERPSRWITRARPKIDRIACPWLVRRFIDPRAGFFYVPADQVLAEAGRREAVAFDIEGGAISHEGELCSFDTLMRAFDLKEPALDALARIVRGADTGRLDLAPEAAGLLAFSLGLSRLHAGDDLAMLEAALPLYDALFADCRSKATAAWQGATPETHGWPPSAAAGASL
jgi:rhodanese-related sulfurtransferase